MSKWYIKIFFCVLILFVYVTNKVLASSPAPHTPTSISVDNSLEQRDVSENSVLCTDPEEIRNVTELMNEAVMHLQYHATSTEEYELVSNADNGTSVYFKKHGGHTDIEKLYNKVPDPNKYNSIIKYLCDLNRIKIVDGYVITVKIARIYTPNLVMVQQRYRNLYESSQKYFYAFATKVEIAENTTAIVYTSGNINDHNRADKKSYRNTIVESANSFKTEVNSDADIRNGELKKLFVNLLGFLIKKEDDHVDFTCVSSIYDSISDAQNPFAKLCRP
ncbi:fam-a protein [Plasmodium chabaudi chabaudi]|uniref:Fam-a protein n=1 Tax=Plasmodium chabaudi chabaudi TaxID=31271 RepID=A0A4V0K2U2_PLACU|nr:fam-a protein [Plasmodium chabaudi chabaudi]VTZ66348.1 fam-a protein [Plasmodium chabaudi chabaudi]|eukprot:XP_016655475.1 fam-a protein [Plasmodium chabaudi chabaudi]